MQNEFLF